MCLHVPASIVCEQTREFAGSSIGRLSKEVPGLKAGLPQQPGKRIERRTVALDQIAFGQAKHSANGRHAPVFVQQFGPVPGPQPALPEALIDQIKKTRIALFAGSLSCSLATWNGLAEKMFHIGAHLFG